MARYKLTHFNCRGRAELSRLLFAAAAVQYDDIRLELDDWPTVKPTMKLPFGKIPLLEVDGITLCQSMTIARFLAHRFGLAGKTELERARADMLIGCYEDINDIIIEFGYFEKDETRKAEKRKKFFDEQLPSFLQHLERLLEENNGGDGYFVGDSLTWADLGLMNEVSWLSVVGADGQIANYPKLNALNERIKKLPEIAEWIEKRPQTLW